MINTTLLGIVCLASFILTNALEDGNIYQFTSSLDGKVLTVSDSEPDAGKKISLEPWQDESSQKWLAVEAVVAGDKYLLIPRRQKWNWNKFVNREGTLNDRHDSLPDFTLALNVDKTQTVSQEFRDSKPYQQWRSLLVDGKSYQLIKNMGTDRCLRNPGEQKKNLSVFQRIKEAAVGTQTPKTLKFALVGMALCDKSDAGQQWTIKKVN